MFVNKVASLKQSLGSIASYELFQNLPPFIYSIITYCLSTVCQALWKALSIKVDRGDIVSFLMENINYNLVEETEISCKQTNKHISAKHYKCYMGDKKNLDIKIK